MKTDLTETKFEADADSLIKCCVGSQIWLVPAKIYSAAFREAARKFNSTLPGLIIEWSSDEKSAFLDVLNHPEVWRPL